MKATNNKKTEEETFAVNEVEFPRESLINSKMFHGYHPAYLMALLKKEKYTKRQAKEIVDNYFNGGKT